MRSHVTFTTRRFNQTVQKVTWHYEDALRRGGSPGAPAPRAAPASPPPSAPVHPVDGPRSSRTSGGRRDQR